MPCTRMWRIKSLRCWLVSTLLLLILAQVVYVVVVRKTNMSNTHSETIAIRASNWSVYQNNRQFEPSDDGILRMKLPEEVQQIRPIEERPIEERPIEERHIAVDIAKLPGENTPLAVTEASPTIGPGGFTGRKLVIAAHARGGSTFIGSMFKMHGNVMYWIEPDSYRDLYLRAELIMPNEVSHLINGSRRPMPEWEYDMHTQATTAMLNCDFRNVPLNILLFPEGVGHHCDKFHDFRKNVNVNLRWQEYLKCLRIIKTAVPMCDWKTPWNMPKHACVNPRYSELYTKWKAQFHLDNFAQDKYLEQAQNTLSCLRPVERHVAGAMPSLRRGCQQSDLNVVKYVRIRLAALLKIIDADPEARGILLTRDPRSIAASRKATWPGWPFRENVVRHTISLCEDVLDDHLLWEKVKDSYSGRIMYVRYEDITMEPETWAQRLYMHAGLESSQALLKWVQGQMHCKAGGNSMNTCRDVQNAEKFNAKWKLTISEAEGKVIDAAEPCKRVYSLLGYKSWGETPQPDPRVRHIPGNRPAAARRPPPVRHRH